MLWHIVAAQHRKGMEVTHRQGHEPSLYSFIWIGYIFSLAGKFALIISAAPQPWYVTVKWYVMFFYVVNIIMVTTGIAIYFRNRALDRRAGKVNEDVPATSSESKRSAAKTAA